MTTFRKLTALVALSCAFAGLSTGAAVDRGTTCGGHGQDVVGGFDQDNDVRRVERLFSKEFSAEGPVAPKVWSSRLDIRWMARWQVDPHILA